MTMDELETMVTRARAYGAVLDIEYHPQQPGQITGVTHRSGMTGESLGYLGPPLLASESIGRYLRRMDAKQPGPVCAQCGQPLLKPDGSLCLSCSKNWVRSEPGRVAIHGPGGGTLPHPGGGAGGNMMEAGFIAHEMAREVFAPAPPGTNAATELLRDILGAATCNDRDSLYESLRDLVTHLRNGGPMPTALAVVPKDKPEDRQAICILV